MAGNQLEYVSEMKKQPMPEKKKQAVLEGLWLTYYNEALYEQGMITEEERNKMRARIKARTASRER